jgi:glycosyltransferase involved in cell wall biosynthesis
MEPVVSPKNVVIFTTFNSADEAYSLNRVVIDQIKMFTQNGYSIRVIVSEGFVPKGEYLNPMVKLDYIPNVPVHNEVKKDETFEDDVERLVGALNKAIDGADVVITHDIIYQNSALKHNFAARKVAENHPAVKWLHWIHSATSPTSLAMLRQIFSEAYLELVKKPFPNSKIVFFNHWSVPRISNNFGVPESSVAIVHHPTDVYDLLNISPEVKLLAEKYHFLKADAICTYPVRLDRGKQVEMAIKTMASLKRHDMSVRIVVIDFHSTAGDKNTYRDELKQIAIDYKLAAGELIFTSEERPAWAYEMPHSMVRDVMALSNVFVMPSVSESYSLVTQENAMFRQVVITNQDFPPFRDIFGPYTIQRKFSSSIDLMTGMDGWTKSEYGPNAASPEERKAFERGYHYDTAGQIKSKLLDGGPMQLADFLRKNRNLNAVFKNELEPLLF